MTQALVPLIITITSILSVVLGICIENARKTGKILGQINGLRQRVEALEERTGKMENHLTTVDERLSRIEGRIGKSEETE